MKQRFWLLPAALAWLLSLTLVAPAAALDEADRLWLVGERAFADRLFPVARRALERFVASYQRDSRYPDGLLMLGKARLALNDPQAALEALQRAQKLSPVPGQPMEARFWEAESLFRLKRFAEAAAAYDDIVRTNAASSMAPDALYGFAWSELELKHHDSAVTAFRSFVTTWPEHTLASSATFQLARALVDLKRIDEALPLLSTYPGKYPKSRHVADAHYLLGWAKFHGDDQRGGLADLRAFVAAHPQHQEVAAARRLIEQGTARTALAQADAAFKQKNYKEAAAQAEVATQSVDDSVKADAWLLLGESELKLKRFATAEKAFEAVGAVPDVEAGVRYRALAGLGLAREEQQEWRGALTAYESVAKSSPDSTLRDWARDRAAAVKTRMKPPPKPSPPAAKPAAPGTKPAPAKKDKS